MLTSVHSLANIACSKSIETLEIGVKYVQS